MKNKKSKKSRRSSRRRSSRRSTKKHYRRTKQRGSGPTLTSCGSGKCSTNSTTVVTYKGTDPVDSVPSFVSAEDAENMQENDQY